MGQFFLWHMFETCSMLFIIKCKGYSVVLFKFICMLYFCSCLILIWFMVHAPKLLELVELKLREVISREPTLLVMVVGVPNVGKSALINSIHQIATSRFPGKFLLGSMPLLLCWIINKWNQISLVSWSWGNIP